MSLSIIIPILNEEKQLPELFGNLKTAVLAQDEVIFVDGGSTDQSVSMCCAAGYRVLKASRGRALQMNRGADQSAGELLLFLHADTRLPDVAGILLSELHQRPVWGRFDVKIKGTSKLLSMVALMMNLRSRLTGIATGDQAIFVSRELFLQVGGFPQQPLMEDIDLCKSLKRLLPPKCLRVRVITSGRRWEQRGVWRTILLMWRLRWRHWRGAPIDEIARAYR